MTVGRVAPTKSLRSDVSGDDVDVDDVELLVFGAQKNSENLLQPYSEMTPRSMVQCEHVGCIRSLLMICMICVCQGRHILVQDNLYDLLIMLPSESRVV